MQLRTEKQLQEYLKRECQKNGISFDKVESRSRRGFPDCFLAKGGEVALVELKSPAGTGTLSPLQVRVIEDLEAHGIEVWVVDSTKLADAVIERLNGVVGAPRWYHSGVKYALGGAQC
jgi:hypothetical protein